MSKENVAEVITKTLVDAEFRSQLLAEPEAALAGYDLTEEEAAALSALEEDALDGFASEVEERFSKGIPIPLPRPLEGIGMEAEQVAELERVVDEIWGVGNIPLPLP